MRSGHHTYLHNLSVKQILQILKTSAWQTENQSITSAVTNDNELIEPDTHYQSIGENTAGPNAFSDITFVTPVKRILDVGGGKYDGNRDYMKKKHIDLLVWDPFNRSSEHNENIQAQVNLQKVDVATSMSVLNVIPEIEARIAHINTLKDAIRTGGYAYFKVWPGDAPFKGSYFAVKTPSYYQANAGADRFLKEILMVFGIGNAWLDKSVPNLIIARKSNPHLTSKQQVALLLSSSKNDEIVIQRKVKHFLRAYYASEQQTFTKNFTLFQQFSDRFIEENRNHDAGLQHEYDKRHGLIPYKG